MKTVISFKYIVSFVLLVCSLQFSFASNAGDSLKKANDLYSAKKYPEALKQYVLLYKSGYSSAPLYFNTGNAYYKTGDFVRAILFYERAKLLDPNNEDITFNLDVAKINQVDKIDAIPEYFFSNWIDFFAGLCSSNLWTIIALVLFLGMLTAAYYFLFSQTTSSKRFLFSIGIVLLLLVILCSSLASYQKKKLTVRNTAIVISPSVTAKSSPDDAGTDLFVFHEGLKVVVMEKVSGWVKIKLSNGSIGWLKQSDIEVI